MAVNAGSHTEPWNVVSNTGVVLATKQNAREALAEAREATSLFPGFYCKAVRA